MNPYAKPLYIFDIDGTLAGLGHRLHYIQARAKPDYDSFYALAHLDRPILPNIRTLLLLEHFADIWFFTGRPEQLRQVTLDWLREHTGIDWPSEVLMMAPAGNTRIKDYQVKAAHYCSMLEEDRDRLVAVFEDRQRCVDMWRHLGITCYQVDTGDY